MDAAPPSTLPEFEVWQDARGWHARHLRKLVDDAAAAGCPQQVTSGDPEDLERSAIALRIRRSWYR